jgi:hypothetical protein
VLGASEPVAAAGLLGSEDRESQHWTQAEYGESIYTVCCFDEVSTAVPNVRAGEAYFQRFARLVWSLMLRGRGGLTILSHRYTSDLSSGVGTRWRDGRVSLALL